MAESNVCLVNDRVGQVWEDQVGRVHLVLFLQQSRPSVGDATGVRCDTYMTLRLSCGYLSGTTTEMFEFSDIPWEKVYTRLA